MKPLVAGASRSPLLILLAVAAGLAATHPAGATDTISPDRWWVDLKPWGDGRISYLLCEIPYELPPEWEQGVENWDAAMSSFMAFDLEPGGCWASADTWLAWELGDECPPFLPGDPEPIACTWPQSWEDHGTWWEMKRVIIYFNHDKYNDLGYWEDAWQVAASAHEWGHNLNLDDHWWADQCWEPNLLMGYADPSHPPCLTGPSPLEVDAVVMNYGLLDSDGDDFEDGREMYYGTDWYDDCPDGWWDAAWPPDMDNDTSCDVGDILLFKPHIMCCIGDACYDNRFDLAIDGCVDVGDILMLGAYIMTSCA